MYLNQLGRIVQECWFEIPQHFPRVELQSYIVMPNHFHGLLALFGWGQMMLAVKQIQLGPNAFGKPVTDSLSTIVGNFKAEVSRRARTILHRPTLQVWQRNFHERVVRNGKEFAGFARYSQENPLRWAFDKENPTAEKS